MRWIVFALVSWVAFGLEIGLRPLLSPGQGNIAPSFVIPVLVYVALWSPARTALWAGLILGVVTDLTSAVDLNPVGAATVIGPHAIGYLLAAQLVVAARGVVIGRRPVTLVVLSVLAALVAGIVVVALFTIRGFYDPIVWRPGSQLGFRTLSALYTGLTAAAMYLVLTPLAGAFQFQSAPNARFARRA
ncbi:MAG: hypothetical protein R3B57_14450 [Phycisphaerales bacterium]